MRADKLSISLGSDLADEVRTAARMAGVGVSAWLAEAARARLRAEALREFLDQWEGQHGPLSRQELADAEEELGLRAHKR